MNTRFLKGSQFSIFYRPETSPTLSSVQTSPWVGGLPFEMTYNDLVKNSDAVAADGNAVEFVITSVSSGSLEENGKIVVPGTTTVGYGDTLTWTPPPGASGLQNAFTVRASDGQNMSATDVPVSVNLVDSAAWDGGLLEIGGVDGAGNVHCGSATEVQSSDPCTFTLANLGSQALQITNFAKAGDQPGDFHVTVKDDQGNVVLDLPAAGGAATGSANFTIPSGATYTVAVVFAPQDMDFRTMQITFNTNDPRDQRQPRVVGADGVGVMPLQSPTLTAIGTLAGATQTAPFDITFLMLSDASDLGDPNPDPHPYFCMALSNYPWVKSVKQGGNGFHLHLKGVSTWPEHVKVRTKSQTGETITSRSCSEARSRSGLARM